MTEEYGSCLLTPHELTALAMLWGKRQLFYLGEEQDWKVTERQAWDACCQLMAAGMLTQVGGRFRMSKVLFDAVTPILTAREALVYRPETQSSPQIIYYRGEGQAALWPTAFGRYAIRPVDSAEDELAERACRVCCGEGRPTWKEMPETNAGEDSTAEQLWEGARFLLESVDLEQSRRRGWLRGVWNGTEPWLERTGKYGIEREPMTRQAFLRGLDEIWKERYDDLGGCSFP